MRIGLCATIDQAALLDLAGLDYLEPPVGPTLSPAEVSWDAQPARATLAAKGLRAEAVNFFIPADLKTTGPDVRVDRLDAFAGRAFERAATLGVQVVVFGSGGSRTVPAGSDHAAAWSQLAGHLRRWAPLAQRAGVRLAVEALNRTECNIINSLDEAAELARQAGSQAVGIVVDTYHMELEGESPEAILRAGELVIHAHCADAAARVPLGLGPGDHRPFFAALRRIGYDGRISIEANWRDQATQLPQAVEGLRRQLG